MAPSRGGPGPGGRRATASLRERAITFANTGGALWWTGCKEACQLQQTLIFFLRSKTVLRNTAQCFLLNGVIFLGSIALLDRVLVPVAKALFSHPARLMADATGLDVMFGGVAGEGGDHEQLLTLFERVMVGLYNVLWLYPAYAISFIANCIWYDDLAKKAFQISQAIAERRARRKAEAAAAAVGGAGGGGEGARGGAGARGPAAGGAATGPKLTRAPSAREGTPLSGVAWGLGEEVYRVILFLVFVAQVFVVSLVPVVGRPAHLLLLSWLYAYYCFDYAWSNAGWPLDRRLAFVESNWAFFSGFGFPCVLMTAFFSTFVSAGVMAMAFPLFVLVATACDPARRSATAMARAGVIWEGMPPAELQAAVQAPMGRLRMFRLAHAQTTWLIRMLFPKPKAK